MRFIFTLITLLSVCLIALPASATEAVSTKAEKMTKEVTKKAKGGKGSRVIATFNKMDTDSNGTISEAEFTNLHIKKFKAKDKNKDNVLSKEEFSPLLKK
jgi:Ca2+-binding EF-hand superfamily protein